ncbi:hypothetical protein QAD02_006882 [Eretmocerus hayati]|uniref:Uncharacterized protein n=1 Tax=Eretmocerus hayati TaxID=131215 RepID=A0ACC2N6I9_9HYME|nr:hypothetical protein QAD02_006882 [Eretmocerus hayati]
MRYLASFAFFLVIIKAVWLVRDMKIPARLIYNGNIYIESWSISAGDTSRYWMQIMQENFFDGHHVTNVIYPQTVLGTSTNKPSKVDNQKCQFNDDRIDNDQCNQICALLEPITPLKGECMNDVCFCLFHTPKNQQVRTYLSLKASSLIKSLDTEDLVEASKKDEIEGIPETGSPISDDGSEIVNIESLLSPENSEHSDYGDEYMDSDHLQVSPSMNCRAHSRSQQEPKKHCTDTNAVEDCSASAGPSVNKCYDGDEEITEEECDFRCKRTGNIVKLDVEEGFCENSKCYCKYMDENGSCREIKLSSLEKRNPKKTNQNVPLLSRTTITYVSQCIDLFQPDLKFF